MGSSPGWLKRASVLCFFGVKAVIFALVAEYKKPLSGKSIITAGGDDGSSVAMCELPRLSVAMGSLSVLSLLLTVIAGHVAVLHPYPTSKTRQLAVPRRALLRKTGLTVFFVIGELASAWALAMLLWATVAQHDNLRYMPTMLPDGTVSCPSSTAKTDGIFGGGALLALDATLMWFVCLLMSLEARADYLDLHGVDDGVDDGNKKKLDLHGDDDIDNLGNTKKLELQLQDDDIDVDGNARLNGDHAALGEHA